jgi:putative CocE/NonD family hydrolase
MRRYSLLLLALAPAAFAQAPANTGDYVLKNYTRTSVQIPMRDGVKLYTTIYSPKDPSQRYPILMTRTPYGVAPYEEGKYRNTLGPNPYFLTEKYIFVYQDVRGRFMSEGEFENMRPQRGEKAPPGTTDESTDTYDTIDWLVRNVPGHNNKVGLFGISYPGFYTSAGMVNAHPNLVAASPQAPIADWFFDDFFHHGAFFQVHAFNFFSRFGWPRPKPTTTGFEPFKYPITDGYRFYLEAGTPSNLEAKHFKGGVAFWNTMAEHPNYDHFWKARNLLPHLKKVAPAVMVVGGWYDAEDLYGICQTFRAIERQNPSTKLHYVMGPWVHGGWSKPDGSKLGGLNFGSNTSDFFQREIELQFFNRHLKGVEATKLAKATMFETGTNRWRAFNEWPPAEAKSRKLYFDDASRLSSTEPKTTARDEFPSDPRKPVPFYEGNTTSMSVDYMVADQRFTWRRPDVLAYQTEPLTAATTVAGLIKAHLTVSTTGTDADWVVKLIDVYPDQMPEGQKALAGSQILVRSEVIRGRFRDSFEKPTPFTPEEPTVVSLELQDVLHTFRPGHRLMVQVCSTWFPIVDRNPQKFVPNIFFAKEEDYQMATHRVHRGPGRSSWIELATLPGGAP